MKVHGECATCTFMYTHLDNDFYFNLSCCVHAAGICFCMKIAIPDLMNCLPCFDRAMGTRLL